jgi:hypothetical protein
VWSSVKLEAWAVGFTAGSREVPGRKGLWQETSISYNNNNNNNDDDDDGDDDDDNNMHLNANGLSPSGSGYNACT